MSRQQSLLSRYGFALLLPVLITAVALNRPALAESSWFLFFGAVVVSACFGGLAPACATAAFSIVLVRLFFITPAFSLDLLASVSGTEQMAVFVLFALAAACLVSGLRRQRDEALEAALGTHVLGEMNSSALMIADEHCRVVFANGAAGRLFERPRLALLGGHLDTLLPGHCFSEHLRTIHEDSRKQPLPLRIAAVPGGAGVLPLDLMLTTVTHDGRTFFAAVISDAAAVGGIAL